MSFKYACIDKKSARTIDLSTADLSAAFQLNALWDPSVFPNLNITFMDGTEHEMEWVKRTITRDLQPLMSRIKFVWNVPIRQSHIRISFKLKNQAWSMIGKEALTIPINQPTMNLGWIDDDINYNTQKFKGTGQVVLHEFGHAIGMIHEHQNPKNNPIVWNKPVVYEELARTNGWDKQQIDHNMFATYGDQERCNETNDRQYCSNPITNGSVYDVTSVMHYFYPQKWLIKGPTYIPENYEFSPLDKEWINKYYGSPGNTFADNNDTIIPSITTMLDPTIPLPTLPAIPVIPLPRIINPTPSSPVSSNIFSTTPIVYGLIVSFVLVSLFA